MEATAREKWAEERLTAVCASEAPAVLGVDPWSSALEVWARKVGALPAMNTDPSEPMRWGTILEPVVLEEYRRRRFGFGQPDADPSGSLGLERHDQTVLIKHPRWPVVPLAATPDAFDWRRWTVEAKTGDARTAEWWDDGPPLWYQVQGQVQLACTGAPGVTIVVLLGGNDLRWFDIERNARFIEGLEARVAAWWAEFVVQRCQPPAESSEAAIRALVKLHPNDNGQTVDLPEAFDALDRRLAEVKAAAKVLEGERKAIERQIMAAIGAATYGRLPGGETYSWKTQERAGYTVAPTTFRQLRRTA